MEKLSRHAAQSTERTSVVGASLRWLVGVFCLCLFLVFALRGYFTQLESDIRQRGLNERARLFVGEEIVRGIQGLEKNIYRMAVSQNAAGFTRIDEELNSQIDKLRHDLGVLQDGGTVRRQLQLNLGSADETTREARYQPDRVHQTVVMELLEIEPQLSNVRERADALSQLLQRRWQSQERDNAPSFVRIEEEIALFLKQIPPYFERLNENANRLFLEGDQRLRALEQELDDQASRLKKVETALILLVVVFGGISGFLFMRRLTGALGEARLATHDAESQREHNETILDTLGDGVYATDLAGNITFLNAAGERILGWSASELVGQMSHLAVHHSYPGGAHFPPEQCPLIAVLQQGVSLDGEEHFVSRDGRFIPVSYRSKPLMVAGQVVGSLVSFHDISERMVSEARIRLQQAALDAAANMIVITSREGLIEYVNPAFCRTSGYTLEEVLGQPASVLNSGVQDDAFYRSMWSALLDGKPWEGELSNRRKNGEVYPEQMTITPIVEAGQIAHFVAIKRDISDEVRTRVRLKLIESAIQETDQGILIMDATAHAEGPVVQYVNAGFTRLTGYLPDDAVGARAGFLRDPQVASSAPAQIRAAIERGVGLLVEIPLRRKDGTGFVGELHLSPVPNDRGEGGHFIGLLSDIDQRKEAEAALRSARDQALENSRLKSEFLSTMSHEIRTPMNGIIGMTDLLLDTELDAEQRDYTGVVRDSAQALLVIINDILDFSKIEAGKLEIEITDFSVTQLLSGTAELLQNKARDKQLEFTSAADPTVPQLLRGDPVRLRQVLLNLVGNAIKFTQRGRIDVFASRVEEPAGSVVRFEVRDTGIGIPVATQAKLFQSFTQADSSTTRKYGGTGLGLAICKRLVELMGGRIGVQSTAGQGSSFWFTLPLSHADNADADTDTDADTAMLPAPAAAVDSAALVEVTLPPQPLVLLVEDNLINQKVAQLQLGKLGYALRIVGNGQEAVDAVQAAWRGDVPALAAVLMDCQMPVLDGFEATKVIRLHELARVGRIPIIAMTANAMEGDRQRCLAAGMDDYLSKPINPVQLRELLAKWVDGSASQ